MYQDRIISDTDAAAFAGFFSWFGLPQAQRLNAIGDRALSYNDLQAIDKEVYALKRIETIKAADIDLSVALYMLADVRARGSQKPEPLDYTASLTRAAERKSNQWGKALPAYKPEPGASGIKMQPARAVRVSYIQESYSDDSVVAIPVRVEPGKPADFAVFMRNVSELVRRSDTHTGMAGSGCNYSTSFSEEFRVVLIHCRSSIAD